MMKFNPLNIISALGTTSQKPSEDPLSIFSPVVRPPYIPLEQMDAAKSAEIKHSELLEISLTPADSSNDDISVENVQQNKTPFKVRFSINSEKGYRYKNNSFDIRYPIHEELEDHCWPDEDGNYDKDEDFFITKTGARIFLLADGHTGHKASRFFVKRIHELLSELIDSRPCWNLDRLDDQTVLEYQIQRIFIEIDQEYCALKTAEYSAWDNGKNVKMAKPVDDGCTFVANIIIQDWLINCNVGDTRTVIATPRKQSDTVSFDHTNVDMVDLHRSQSSPDIIKASSSFWSVYSSPHDKHVQNIEKNSRHSVYFASDDHNMSHGAKLHHINDNGGKFLTPFGKFVDSRFLPSIDSTSTLKPLTHGNGPHPLLSSRIFRPKSSNITSVGVSNKRTLNLTATMGDLLFKVEPAVLSSVPDVKFIKLERNAETEEFGTMVLMATDGLWDHLKIRETHAQNVNIANWVSCNLEIHNDEDLQDQLDAITKALVTRAPLEQGQEVLLTPINIQRSNSVPIPGMEGTDNCVKRKRKEMNLETELFDTCGFRYDDVMALVILLK